ncbi:MAG: subclass B3 metallo-beta-lactamase [Pyrinomonadaceae bacterium]|nr:subclass B3 metallo-beta-lactamase [Pyrinomonadaceae bacterium]
MDFRSNFLSLLLLFLAVSTTAQVRSDADRRMNGPAEPFKIIGNIYYVGASDVASYLITTKKGHILIDGGFEETAPRIEKNIEKVGFRLRDVKILLNNHAHYDHAGGLNYLRKNSGAMLLANRQQAEALRRGGKNDFAYENLLTFTPVEVDQVIKPDATIKLGSVKLKTIFTPGHTKGATTWVMSVNENGRKLRIVFQSSLSALPKYNLIDNPLYPDHAEDFRKTFTKLKEIKADVFLGSHAQFFKMKEKLEIWKTDKSRNPFIDPEGYRAFIERAKRAFESKLSEQKQQKLSSFAFPLDPIGQNKHIDSRQP